MTSLREGLEETLTISRLSLSPALVRTFQSINPIESLNDGIRVVERNVKRPVTRSDSAHRGLAGARRDGRHMRWYQP